MYQRASTYRVEPWIFSTVTSNQFGGSPYHLPAQPPFQLVLLANEEV